MPASKAHFRLAGTRPDITRQVRRAALLAASLLLAALYARWIDRPHLDDRLALHSAIVEGWAPSPYRYRVLVPLVAELPLRLLSGPLGERAAFFFVYALLQGGAITLFLFSLERYLSKWGPARAAFLATLLTALTMPAAFREHFFQPWSLLEPALLALGLEALRADREGRFTALVAVAALNRESAFLLPLIQFVVGRPAWRRPAVNLTVAGALWLGLRAVRGWVPHMHAWSEVLAMNLRPGNPMKAALLCGILVGPLSILAWLGRRGAPAFARRAASVAPLYFAAFLACGVWTEARLLLPLLPLLLPLAMQVTAVSGLEVNLEARSWSLGSAASRRWRLSRRRR